MPLLLLQIVLMQVHWWWLSSWGHLKVLKLKIFALHFHPKYFWPCSLKINVILLSLVGYCLLFGLICFQHLCVYCYVYFSIAKQAFVLIASWLQPVTWNSNICSCTRIGIMWGQKVLNSIFYLPWICCRDSSVPTADSWPTSELVTGPWEGWVVHGNCSKEEHCTKLLIQTTVTYW